MNERVADIGEFGLIEKIEAVLREHGVHDAGVKLGIGDDAAVWNPAANEHVVITADSLIEQIHFRIDWIDWESLGWKSLAVNLSDIAAMGAQPSLAVVSLSLNGSELVEEIEAFYRGMAELASQCDAQIAGGDLTATRTDRMIAITVLGQTHQQRLLTRRSAQTGDLIVVSGYLGAAAAGLRLLDMNAHDPRRNASVASQLINAHLRPIPRVELGRMLADSGVETAMDLSDGLLGDLPKILTASQVNAIVDIPAVPILAAVRTLFPQEAEDLALSGGEDYELLFTVEPTLFPEIQAAANELDSTLTPIGAIVAQDTESPELWLRDAKGHTAPADSGAFDHFG